MGTVRTQITSWFDGDDPADYATNSVFHTIGGSIFDPTVDYQNHANQVRDLFSGQNGTYSFQVLAHRHMRVVAYDLGDPEPRPERAVALYTPEGAIDAAGASGPRQVALCLSFYGTRNLPSQRGRIYIGPFNPVSMGLWRPALALQNELLTLGHGLFDIGGEDVAHVVRSRKNQDDTVVANYYVKDTWDVIRRRQIDASSRVTLAP